MSNLFSRPLFEENTRKFQKESPECHANAGKSLGSFGQVGAVIVLGLILAMSAAQVMGQAVNGAFLGTITDSTGAAVSGAKVTITEQNQNVSRSALRLTSISLCNRGPSTRR